MREVNPDREIDFKKIKAILLDWDGVFHGGYKNHLGESTFSEADSMGLNMLRLGFYQLNKTIPFTAIITGESNPTALYLAEREHLDGFFFKVKNKHNILEFLKKEHKIKPEEVLFVFDDILDIGLAKEVGARFLIQRNASKKFRNFVVENDYCDYITESSGDEHAVREVCEFILDELNIMATTFETRIAFGPEYLEYLNKRQERKTHKFSGENNELKAAK